ncbi:MAG: hypothetical protein FIB08_07585 [Candidatus Methanoperedens sp.]|nr:hypothetical protein [Candidatus Methanoperedens sp.]
MGDEHTKVHTCKENDWEYPIIYLTAADADNFIGDFRSEGWHIELEDNGIKLGYCPFCGIKLISPFD